MAVVEAMADRVGAGGGDGVPVTEFDKLSPSGRQAILLMDEFGVVEP